MLAASDKPERALYDVELQSLARGRLDALRARAVDDLLRRLRSSATRYAKPAAELRDYALFSGSALAAEVETHRPFGRLQATPEPLIRAGLSTASVPRPVPIAWTRADLDREAALGARALWRAGLRPRGRSTDALDGGLVTPGTLAIADALDTLDALALPVGPITTPEALSRAREVWEIVRAQVLIADVRSFDFLEQGGALPASRSVVLMTPTDAERLRSPARSDVFRVLSIPPACTFAAAECAAHHGYHVAEDDLAVEIADPSTGAALPDGERGTLVLTTLRRSLSLVRFDTGIHAALDRTPCTCGDTHARLFFD